MRLAILDSGHTLGKKAMMVMIRMVLRQPAPDVIKTLLYRPDFLGDPLSVLCQEVMRGPSAWSVGDRELMAAYVSRSNECEF
jgi:hypothetical protein